MLAEDGRGTQTPSGQGSSNRRCAASRELVLLRRDQGAVRNQACLSSSRQGRDCIGRGTGAPLSAMPPDWNSDKSPISARIGFKIDTHVITLCNGKAHRLWGIGIHQYPMGPVCIAGPRRALHAGGHHANQQTALVFRSAEGLRRGAQVARKVERAPWRTHCTECRGARRVPRRMLNRIDVHGRPQWPPSLRAPRPAPRRR